MPVYLRVYYIRKLSKMFADEKKQHEKQMRQIKSKSPKKGRR